MQCATTLLNQESRLPPGSDFRRWVWITIAPFVTLDGLLYHESDLEITEHYTDTAGF
ncbi:Tn3 family transposase, partial [Escherichia coli]